MTIEVKCRICGKKKEKSEAYKVVINNKNNYYCNETEYREWASKKEIKKQQSNENQFMDIFYIIFSITYNIDII